MLTLHHSVIFCAGQPLFRFASTAQAGVFMLRLGYRAEERGGVWMFWK